MSMPLKRILEKIKDMQLKEGTWTPVLSCQNETAPTVSLTMQQRKICKNWKISFRAILHKRSNNNIEWNK